MIYSVSGGIESPIQFIFQVKIKEFKQYDVQSSSHACNHGIDIFIKNKALIFLDIPCFNWSFA